MSARRKAAPPPPPPPPAQPEDDGVKRPNPLLLMGLVVCGLWTQFWLGGLLLIPIAFGVTWAGRWERRHSLMAAGAVLWLMATTAILAGEPRRDALGLGSWDPPEWLVTAGTRGALVALLMQGIGIGLLVWAADGMRPIFKRKTD